MFTSHSVYTAGKLTGHVMGVSLDWQPDESFLLSLRHVQQEAADGKAQTTALDYPATCPACAQWRPLEAQIPLCDLHPRPPLRLHAV
ncbi:hypothetical protein GDO81_028349 [Engystomops pustulosus]|uniref:Uncharacterized protein n=1 Tax=Engystomops pustulosus TaxID=76066 RepID=A0AAV6YE88_ENGPU|nr:hypothetical protein GDO81_028349 [Engystomops pustulosus]